MDEGRRSARFLSEVWVGVHGHDEAPVRRRGDLSTSGLYFETDRALGEPGSVVWLYLASADKARDIELMAHVVRTVYADGESSVVRGVALELMPETDARVDAVHRFVAHVLAERIAKKRAAGEKLPVVDRFGRTSSRPVGNLSFEAHWPVPAGLPLSVELSAPHLPAPVRLRGTAVSSERIATRGGERHRVEVAVHQEQEGPLRRLSSTTMGAVRLTDSERQVKVSAPASQPQDPHPGPDSAEAFVLARSVDDLVGGAVTIAPPPMPERAAHLSGSIDLGRVAMLAATFELEGVSGVLRLERGAERARIFVRDGRPVEVLPRLGDESAREAFARVVAWHEGSFELVVGPVTREDAVGAPFSQLLADGERAT